MLLEHSFTDRFYRYRVLVSENCIMIMSIVLFTLYRLKVSSIVLLTSLWDQTVYVIKEHLFYFVFLATSKSKRKAMNRNWYNQKANPALNTKVGNK